MASDTAAIGGPDTQKTFWEGETVRKKRAKSVRIFPLNERGNKDTESPPEKREPHVPHPDSPITTALYVAADLSSWMLTGHAADLADVLTGPVLPEEAGKRGPATWQRLDADGWRQLRGQLAGLQMSQFSADKRRVIESRIDALAEWAACEGWQ